MRKLMTVALIASGSISASPALAAPGPFFSLSNTDFIVVLAFLLFIAILIYFKVPALLAGMLDKRAEGIRSELDEARAIREEAQTLLASYERKQQEVKAQSQRIVDHAFQALPVEAGLVEEDLVGLGKMRHGLGLRGFSVWGGKTVASA